MQKGLSKGLSMKNRRRVTRNDRQEEVSGDPWTWSGGTVTCRWCNGTWNHEADCVWLTTRRRSIS
jgi:hypothetical protein